MSLATSIVQQHQTKDKIGRSHISAVVCAQLQQEERDALTAIYDDLVFFEEVTQTIDAKSNINETISRDETKEEEEKKETKQGDLDAASQSIRGSIGVQQCQGVTVTIKPYPASGPERNLVSTRVRFILPPLYPYLRPSFKLLTCEGEMNSADGMMCSTAIQDAMNEIYEKEPMDESEVRVMLFDLINAAQEFLIEYIAFLEDKEYHAKLEAEEAERQRLLEVERLRKEAEMKHAAAALAYQSSDHTKLEWANANQVDSKSKEEIETFEKNISAFEEKNRYIIELQQQLALRDKRQEQADAAGAQTATAASSSASFASATSSTVSTSSPYSPIDPPVSLDNFLTLLPSPRQLITHLKNDPNFHFHHMFAEKTLFLRLIVSKFLTYRFLQRRAFYQRKNRPTRIEIAFHGTTKVNAAAIEQHGLGVPGQIVGGREVVHVSDSGYYGKGIYLSPYVSLAAGSGWLHEQLLVCLVLRGRVKLYKGGAECQKGADSQIDFTGREWVIFDSHAVLPIYNFSLTNPDP